MTFSDTLDVMRVFLRTKSNDNKMVDKSCRQCLQDVNLCKVLPSKKKKILKFRHACIAQI